MATPRLLLLLLTLWVATGPLWAQRQLENLGRRVAADIDPANPGAEMWFSGSNGLLNLKGERIGNNPPPHPGFHIGEGMKPPRRVPITVANPKPGKPVPVPVPTKATNNP